MAELHATLIRVGAAGNATRGVARRVAAEADGRDRGSEAVLFGAAGVPERAVARRAGDVAVEAEVPEGAKEIAGAVGLERVAGGEASAPEAGCHLLVTVGLRKGAAAVRDACAALAAHGTRAVVVPGFALGTRLVQPTGVRLDCNAVAVHVAFQSRRACVLEDRALAVWNLVLHTLPVGAEVDAAVEVRAIRSVVIARRIS